MNSFIFGQESRRAQPKRVGHDGEFGKKSFDEHFHLLKPDLTWWNCSDLDRYLTETYFCPLFI